MSSCYTYFYYVDAIYLSVSHTIVYVSCDERSNDGAEDIIAYLVVRLLEVVYFFVVRL